MAIETPTKKLVALVIFSIFGFIALERFLALNCVTLFHKESENESQITQYSTLPRRLTLQHKSLAIARISGIHDGEIHSVSSTGTSPATQTHAELIPSTPPTEVPNSSSLEIDTETSREENSFDHHTISPPSDKLPRLPKALIIGFSKCGTAALRTFLTIHPDVVSPILELRYFTLFYSKGPEWYRKQMPPSTKDQLTIEKTPSYIMTNQSLRRIYDFNPKFKLIAIVRDPIIRLQSQYAHFFVHADSSEKPSFQAYWGEKPDERKIARSCHYAKYIRKVYNLFPKRQLLVLSEDDMERDPLPVLKEAEKFLELRPTYSDDMFVYNKTKGFHCFNTRSKLFPRVLSLVQVSNVTGCLGRSKGREHPQIEREYLETLKRVIRPLNEDLFDLIGKKFQWDNFIDKS